MHQPRFVIFDVNQTLSDFGSLTGCFEEVGAAGHLAETWFSSVLRDGFALTAAGGFEPFAAVAAEAARRLLAGAAVPDVSNSVDAVMKSLSSLQVHADVPAGVGALRRAGLRLGTLSNGSVESSEALLTRAGLRQDFDVVLSVDEVRAWKPARVAYDYAVRSCGSRPSDVMLVAVHPWDVDGAARAGLRTAWIDRVGDVYPSYLQGPDLTVTGVEDLATQLAH